MAKTSPKPSRRTECREEDAGLSGAAGCGQYAVRTVFRRREPDFSGLHGTAGGKRCLDGRRRLSYYRCRAAAAGGSCAGHQPGGWASWAQLPGREKIWTAVYLRSLSNHRPLFCDSPVRHGVLYSGDPANSARNGTDRRAGGLFPAVFRGGAGPARRLSGRPEARH